MRPGGRIDLRVLDAEAVAQTLVGGEGLHEGAERGHGGVAGIREERMIADHAEIEATGLKADDPFDRTHLDQLDIESSIPALIGESAFRRAGVKFRVRVVGHAETIRKRAHHIAGDFCFARQIPAALLQADGDVLLGDAVGGIETRIGKAHVAVGRQIRNAEAGAAVIGGSIGDAAHRRTEIVRRLVEAVDMVGEGTDRPFGEHAGGTEAIDGTDATHDRLALGEALVRDARVDEIDDAAEDARAVEQGRRTAEDLCFADGERVDAHRVVRAGGRGVEAVDAVLGDLETIAVEAADDRAAGVGTEVARNHAGEVGEQVADVGLGKAVEVGAREDEGRRHRRDLAADGRALDHDRLEFLGGGRLVLGGQGERRGGEHEDGTEGGKQAGFHRNTRCNSIALSRSKRKSSGCSHAIIPRTTPNPMSESSPTPEAIHSDAFLARLMRDQLKLSIACALCFAVALVALPLLNYYQPAFMAQRVFGFTLTWLILGVLFFPFVWIISYVFIKRSIALEDAEAQAAQDGLIK